MLIFKINLRFHNKKGFLLILIILIMAFSSIIIFTNNNKDLNDFYENPEYKTENPKVSGPIWGIVNLTNSIIDNTSHYHNETIPIGGELIEATSEGISGYLMVIFIDGQMYSDFNETTDVNGEFLISLTIPFSLNIYSNHTIEADVYNPSGPVALLNHYTIEVNAISYFDIDSNNQDIPQLAGSTYNIPGFLRYDNNSGIPYQLIDISWYNESLDKINTSTTYTNSDGSFKSISIPGNNSYKLLRLNLTYNGNSTYINGTNKLVSISLYRNITCVWNTVASATEGNQITIQGQIFGRNNSYLKINFTEVRLRISGASIGTTFTNETGIFTLTYTIPSGTVGTNTIEIELFDYPDIKSNNTHLINIAAAPVTPSEDINGSSDKNPPPFQNFFMVLIPIIIGIVAGFAVFAYFYLRKQEEESKLIKLPLEDRIRNFKILKETGRMEESLSYLFQSIYMELINGKYGRRIEENETIRDFAIISVKDLNLNPATIYPFIQKVEEIIYARPFIINDKDFYETVELFSPIYFELTGYNFVLNF